MKIYHILMAGLLAAALSSCNRGPAFRQEQGIVWNTIYHISYESEQDLSDSIISVFNEIDASLSPFNGNSTVTKINENKTTDVDVHFRAVYEESLNVNRETEGAFDPTLAPLIRAWGFGQGHEVSPDTLRLDSLLQITGIGKTRLTDAGLIKEDPRMEFNFSALAKGYGVDCVARMLERNGVANYLVEVGGEIRCGGHNPDGRLWTVGIDRPEAGAAYGETVLTVSVTDAAIATSGNYRNYQESGGRRFGHTISPTSGRPVETDVISATVIAPGCMEADALATSCMVVGSEAALSLCSRLGVAVMLVKADMEVVTNPDFEALSGKAGSLEQ